MSSPPQTDRPLEAVVFDLDGVLIDSHAAVVSSINAALVEHGFAPRDEKELLRFIGPPTYTAFAELTGQDRESELVAASVDTYHERYEQVFLEQTTLVPGIDAVLEVLVRRLPLGIATSKPAVFVKPLLERLGIARFFRVAEGPALSSDDEEDKTTTVRRVLGALGSSYAAVVGDRHYDIEAARALGLPAVGVTWGIGSAAELRGAGAEILVDSPSELVRSLPGLAD